MISLLILFFSIALSTNQNIPSNALASPNAILKVPAVNPRIARPTTAQLPVTNTQSMPANRNRRQRRTNKKIKGKAKKAIQLAQMANLLNSDRVEANRVYNSRSSAIQDILPEEHDSNTMISSIADDDLSAYLSLNAQDLNSASHDDNTREVEYHSLGQQDKPDWVKVDAPADDDEWSIVDDDRNTFFDGNK